MALGCEVVSATSWLTVPPSRTIPPGADGDLESRSKGYRNYLACCTLRVVDIPGGIAGAVMRRRQRIIDRDSMCRSVPEVWSGQAVNRTCCCCLCVEEAREALADHSTTRLMYIFAELLRTRPGPRRPSLAPSRSGAARANESPEGAHEMRSPQRVLPADVTSCQADAVVRSMG